MAFAIRRHHKVCSLSNAKTEHIVNSCAAFLIHPLSGGVEVQWPRNFALGCTGMPVVIRVITGQDDMIPSEG